MDVCRILEDKLLWDFPNTWDSRRIDLIVIYLSIISRLRTLRWKYPFDKRYSNIQKDRAIFLIKGTVSKISSDPSTIVEL